MKAEGRPLTKALKLCYPFENIKGILKQKLPSAQQSPVQQKYSKSIQRAQTHIHTNTHTQIVIKTTIVIWNSVVMAVIWEKEHDLRQQHTHILQKVHFSEALTTNTEATVHRPLVIQENSYTRSISVFLQNPNYPFTTHPSPKDTHVSRHDSSKIERKIQSSEAKLALRTEPILRLTALRLPVQDIGMKGKQGTHMEHPRKQWAYKNLVHLFGNKAHRNVKPSLASEQDYAETMAIFSFPH